MPFIDGATAERLAVLRRHDTLSHYASDLPETGQDETGAVSVTIDPTRRLTRVVVHELLNHLREPGALRTALRRAWQDAVGRSIDSGIAASGRAAEPLLDRAVAVAGPTPRPELHRFGYSSEVEIELFRRRAVAPAGKPVDRSSGVSANDCVNVTLHATDQYGDVEVDPGWLRSARAAAVGIAVQQAFADAYRRRDAR